jgi:hypothetical protein
MLASPLYTKVYEMLTPLSIVVAEPPKKIGDAIQEFKAIISLVQDLLKSHPETKETLNALADWASSSSPSIRPELAELFRHARAEGSTVIGRLIPILYLHSLRLLMGSKMASAESLQSISSILGDATGAVAELEKRLRNIDADALAFLVVEAEMRARESPRLAQGLYDAEQGFIMEFKPTDEAETHLDSSSEFGLERLGRAHLDKWWALPAHIGLAIAVWQQDLLP